MLEKGVQVQTPPLSGDSLPPVQPVNADSLPQTPLVTSHYDVFNVQVVMRASKTIKLNLTVWRHEKLLDKDDYELKRAFSKVIYLISPRIAQHLNSQRNPQIRHYFSTLHILGGLRTFTVLRTGCANRLLNSVLNNIFMFWRQLLPLTALIFMFWQLLKDASGCKIYYNA